MDPTNATPAPRAVNGEFAYFVRAFGPAGRRLHLPCRTLEIADRKAQTVARQDWQVVEVLSCDGVVLRRIGAAA